MTRLLKTVERWSHISKRLIMESLTREWMMNSLNLSRFQNLGNITIFVVEATSEETLEEVIEVISEGDFSPG